MRPTAGGPRGEGSGDEADDVMDASQGLGDGGGRRGCGPDYVTSSLCAPPPGPHALVGSTGRCRRDFNHCRDPSPGTSSGWPGALVSVGSAGRGLLVNGVHPPTPPPRAGGSCVRACVLGVCVGALSAPSVLKHGFHQSQDLRDGSLPPLSPREDGSPFTHPNQEVLETSAPSKPYCDPDTFSPSVLPRSPS